MENNYYNILNVDKNATLEEIKSSYRKKALLYHPDKNINKNDKNKIDYEKKFKELSEAYQILSNSDTRKKYDENNMKWTFEEEAEFENPFEVFEKFFDDIPCEYIYFTTKIIHKLTKLETTFLSNIINEIPDENKLKPAIQNINKIIENKYNLYKKNNFTNKDINNKNKNKSKNENSNQEKNENIIFETMENINNSYLYLKKEDLNIKTTIYISLEEVYNNEIKKMDITRLIIKDKEKIKDKKTFIFSVNDKQIIYYNEGDQYYNINEKTIIYGDIIINIEYKNDDLFKNYKIINNYDLLYEKNISLFEFIYGTEFELLFFNNEILKIKKEEYGNKKEFQIISGKGLPEKGTPEKGTPEKGTPEKGTPEKGTPEKGTPEKGTPEKGTPEKAIFQKELLNNSNLKSIHLYGNLYIKYKLNLDNLNYSLLKNEEIKKIIINLFPPI